MAGETAQVDERTTSSSVPHRHPKRLIFAPGDIAAPPLQTASTKPQQPMASPGQPPAIPIPFPISHLSISEDQTLSGISTPTANAAVVSHPARAHQFITNPPLRFSHLHPTNPLHQFHTWFSDARLAASSAPETCTLATASLPSGRVSARIVYLKELDERGWVVYSNWGSRAGKGGQVFGTDEEGGDAEENSLFSESGPDAGSANHQGNKWGALTFLWASVERQVRIEGLIEPLSKEESEIYWRVRERGSQIGAWASQQSSRLWSVEPEQLEKIRASGASGATSCPSTECEDDGRSVLENRVREAESRFADVQDIPLPPFWGGVRIVPESVEFWQGRKSRLHDRFRYVRVHSKEGKVEENSNEKTFKWRIERLSP